MPYLIEVFHVIHTVYSILDDGGAILGVCVIMIHRFHFATASDEE